MKLFSRRQATPAKTAASEAVVWENSAYYEDAENWTWLFWSEDHAFLPLFEQLNPRKIVELACGHGRHSEMALARFGAQIESLVGMDILRSNVEWCRRRLEAEAKAQFALNDGVSFQPLADGSVTAIFCYDAMVHFHRSVIQSYLKDTRRLLASGGKGLFHHSNYDKDPDAPFGRNPHARAYMSAALFKAMAEDAGLEVLSQRVIAWGGSADLDCLTMLCRP